MPTQYEIATALVQQFHSEQLYGDKPYVYHLLGVAKLCREGGGDEREQTVALLHDILEDTPCTAHKLRVAGISEGVVEAVQAMSKSLNESHRDYLKRCWENPMARRVKMNDSLFNLTHSVKEGNLKRIKRYAGNIGFLAEYKSTKGQK